MRILVTGSGGLVGSEAVRFFSNKGCDVIGVDNNLRADFFGPRGDTRKVSTALQRSCARFVSSASESVAGRGRIHAMVF